MSEAEWKRLNVTTEELNRFTKAFKSEEFRQLFADYCNEITDPENRRAYEAELKQLEAERGVDVTFINAEPGFVIKTCESGNQKVFINVAKCDNIAKPSCECGQDDKTGQKGLNWRIPYVQSRRKQDFDNNKVVCGVYDVVFHSDTLHLASKNATFRKLVIDTACDAVKSAFNVSLDTTNLKFPKLAYKGHPQPVIIRKKTANGETIDCQLNILDQIYPPRSSSPPSKAQRTTKCFNKTKSNSDYKTPHYEIIHRRHTEMHELTNELDAKLNITLPAELVVKIDLPLMTSSKGVDIDVNTKSINLCCDTPAKYKLLINLPYEVDKEHGNAKFDSTKRQLIIILPVLKNQKRGLKDLYRDVPLYREDSGVESDHHSPKEDSSSSSGSGDDVFEDAIDDEYVKPLKKQAAFSEKKSKEILSHDSTPFLDSTISYTLPHFTYNRFENTVALTLHVKNVEPDSINADQDAYGYKLKFTSIGSGYFPIHYAFYFAVTSKNTSIKEDSFRAEPWDNNVIVHIELDSIENFHSYHAGLSENDCKTYKCPHTTEQKVYSSKCKSDDSDCVNAPETNDDVEIKTAMSSDELKIEIKNKSVNQKNAEIGTTNKSNKPKKGRMNRSYSESHCDDLKDEAENRLQENVQTSINSSNACAKNPSKSRTQSESSNDEHHMELFPLKSILKRNSSYDRQASESTDDAAHGAFSGSIDLGIGSFTSIPEEKDEQMSESVRKTVRFDKHLCRKLLFRMNSTIVGQRKPKENKRKKKKHSRDRRYSEGEASDYENNVHQNGKGDTCNGQCGAVANVKSQNSHSEKVKETSSKPVETKNGLIFDIEI